MLSFQVIDVAYALLIHPLLKTAPNFVVKMGLLGGPRSDDMNSDVATRPGADIRRWLARARWAGALYCRKCLGCHGNCCSWYSAVLIIVMLNYEVLLHYYLCQMLFTMLDFCDSCKAYRPIIRVPGFF